MRRTRTDPDGLCRPIKIDSSNGESSPSGCTPLATLITRGFRRMSAENIGAAGKISQIG